MPRIIAHIGILIILLFTSNNVFSQCDYYSGTYIGDFATIPTNQTPNIQQIDASGGCYTIDVDSLPGCFCFSYAIDTSVYTAGIFAYVNGLPSDTASIIGQEITTNSNQNCLGDISDSSDYILSTNIYDINGNAIESNCTYTYGTDYEISDVINVCFEIDNNNVPFNSITICVGQNGADICYDTIYSSVCYGGDYTFTDGVTHYNVIEDETYAFSYISSTGCDSVIVTNLVVDPVLSSTIDTVLCEEYPGNGSGSPLLYQSAQGNTYGDGTYMETYMSESGCDSVVFINVQIISVIADTVYAEICDGEIYLFDNDTITNQGTYTQVYTAESGCDSTVILELTVNPTYNINENITICENQSITYPDGITETPTANTTHTSNLTSVNGCDSIITTNVSVVSSFVINISSTICSGDTFYTDNNYYTQTGTYQETYTSASACDSTVTYNLTVIIPDTVTEQFDICYDNTFTFADGTQLNITGDTNHTSIINSYLGCDSVIITNISVINIDTTFVDTVLCNGVNYISPQGNTYGSGIFTENYLSVNSCDSIVIFNVQVIPNISDTIFAEICDGETYYFDTQAVTTQGTYTQVYTAQSGCDSTVVLELTVNPTYNISENVTICENQSITYPDGITESPSTNTSHISNLTSITGCDSIITTNVSVVSNFVVSINPTICSGDTFYTDNNYYTQTGTYQETYTSVTACDSTVTYNLTVINTDTVTEQFSICYDNTYTFADGTQLNITSDTGHTSIINSYLGCDSVIITNISVINIDTTFVDTVLCNGLNYTSPQGNTYGSGVFTENYLSTNSCDSVVIYNVQVIPVNTNTIFAEICDGDTYYFDTQAITTQGTYANIYTAQSGCDSTVILELTVNPTYSINENVTICENQSITYPDGVSETPTSNTSHISSFTSTMGCDSIVITNVTVNQNPEPLIYGYDFCEGLPATLYVDSNFSSVLWSTSDTVNTITVYVGDTYTVSVIDINGCFGTDSIEIVQYPLPSHSIYGNDFCEGSVGTLSADTGYVNYLWNTNDTTSQIAITIAGIYSVTVTDIHGCTSDNSKQVNTYSTPNVTITSSDNSICEGETTELTVSNYNSYIWNTGETTSSIIVSDNGQYSVTVTDNNGCTNTSYLNITVNENPNPEILGNLNVCEANNGVLSINDNYSSYNWNTGETTSNISVETSGIYSVTVTNSEGCVGADSVSFNVVPNPNPEIIGNTYFCKNSNTQLSLNNSYNSYLWSTGGTSSSITVNETGIYHVTVTNSYGCTGETSVSIQEENIIISITEDLSICQNSDANIYVSAEGGVMPYNFSWDNAETNFSQTVSPTEITTYTVTVTDANLCTGVDSVTINVVSNVEYEAYSNKDSICPGDPVLVTNSIENGLPPYTVYDSYGNIISQNGYFYPSNSGTYIFKAEDACGTTDYDTINIYIEPVPYINIQADVLQGCPPLTVHFTETNLGDAANSYTWTFDNIDDNNLSLSPTPNHTFEISGSYDVSLTIVTDNGCTVNSTITDMINVFTKPQAKFDARPDITTIVDPIFYFENYSTHATSYIWSFDDGDTSNLTYPSHKYNYIGDYNVQLIAISDKGCTDTVKHLMTVTDVTTIYIPTAFSPDGDGINDYFYPTGRGLDLDSYNMKIYNRWGELIWETDDFFARWDGRVRDLGDIVQTGSYVWLVTYKPIEGHSYQKSGKVTVIR